MPNVDYQSDLTGQQMDDALHDLNNHTTLYGAEAWARGTKGGVDVGSTDPTFHNNARYYAEVAQSAVPSENGAVLWNQSQNLSASEKAQARANIACGSSNRNLLDNGWFGSGVINQRGWTSAVAYGQYTVDRWKANRGTFTLTSSGMQMAMTSGQTSCSFYQLLERSVFLTGEQITASVSINGVIYSHTFNASGEYMLTSDVKVALEYGGSTFAIYILTTNNVTINCAKLELGSVSTLANDTAPDTASELAKCERYCYVLQENENIGFGFARHTDKADVVVRTNLRTTPTATMTGTVWLNKADGSNLESTSISIVSGNRGLNIRFTTSGATQGEMYRFTLISNSRIILSADL